MYDIEILEEFLKFWINHGWIPSIKQDRVKQYLKQLENLIQENKELKEMLKRRIAYTRELEEDLFENSTNYVIPKSKVKEKIEYFKECYNSLSKNPKEHLHSKTEYLIVIGELESLLEEGE